MSDTVKITSHDLCVALKLEHPADEYVTVFEVREAAGSAMGSRADALVLSLWASRGLDITGFEFKCNRGDWLAELKNPEKADRIARYCDRWCLFAAPGVVREAELPIGWGLWELSANGTIRRRVAPALREAEAMPRAFVASLLRSRHRLDADDLAALNAKHREQWEREQRAREAESPATLDAATRRDLERLRTGLRKLDEIREATGIDLTTYTPSRQWIERMRLADSVALEHKLRLLRDLFGDHDLRKRIEQALQADAEDARRPGDRGPR
ncbi:hypothetical protein GCM10007067_08620 [Lysobacter bugurensis]|uniref:MmcB family DNA repair protein n=1 Tax=Cognatilysobacter bugurensis TaxID=543356 RepID=A0A918W7W9_9GAMM|nr:hypothetical protein GCM10007067_08620 [Lysobacter bugurensis]